MNEILILSLIVAQIQVEAKSCCPSTTARNCYNVCHLGGKIPRPVCAKTCGCKNVDGKCPPGYHKDILENSVGVCIFCVTVCNAINTLQNSGEEVVNEAVETCYKACSAFCTKGSTSAVDETA